MSRSFERNIKPKTPISKFNVLKSNCLNYGVFFFGYIVFYIVLLLILQSVFQCNNVVSNIIADVLIIIISLCLFFRFRCKLKVPSFQSHTNTSLFQILFWCIYMFFISYLLLVFFQWFSLNIPDNSMIQRETEMKNNTLVFYLFFSCIIAPLAEESMIRLYAYNQLKRSSNWIVAMIISSFVFAVLHGTLTHSILATVFGITLTLAYEYTGCWFLPVIGHIIYNATALLLSESILFGRCDVAVAISAVIFIITVIIMIVRLQFKMANLDYQDMIS